MNKDFALGIPGAKSFPQKQRRALPDSLPGLRRRFGAQTGDFDFLRKVRGGLLYLGNQLLLFDNLLFLGAEHVDSDAMAIGSLEGLLIDTQITGFADQPLAVNLDILVSVDGAALDLEAAVLVALGKDKAILKIPLALCLGVAEDGDLGVMALMESNLLSLIHISEPTRP